MHHHRHDDSFYRALREILRGILCCGDRLYRAISSWQIGNIDITFEGDFQMLLPDDAKTSASATFVDKKGNPAVVQSVVWATDRPDLLTVTDNGDGTMSVAAVGPLGSAQVTCTGDADLGDGVREVVLLGTIEVIAGEAVGGTIEFSEPTPQ